MAKTRLDATVSDAGHVEGTRQDPGPRQDFGWSVPQKVPTQADRSATLQASDNSKSRLSPAIFANCRTAMAPRASSPAVSENEFDIFDALAGGDDIAQESGQNAELGIDLDIGSDGGSDDEAFIAAKQAASNRKASNLGKSIKKGGGFQAMGLNAALLKAITQKGFKVPTPIQRKAVPLMLQGDDVVGMARTGSGKTAAFVIPMIQKLKAHSAKVGARGVIMSPSRELALQTLKVVKELGRGTDLRTILLVGGDSLEERTISHTLCLPFYY